MPWDVFIQYSCLLGFVSDGRVASDFTLVKGLCGSAFIEAPMAMAFAMARPSGMRHLEACLPWKHKFAHRAGPCARPASGVRVFIGRYKNGDLMISRQGPFTVPRRGQRRVRLEE